MDNVRNNYIHVGVDPYGDLVYQHCDDQPDRTWQGFERGVAPTYPDSMRDQMLYDFKPYRNEGRFTLCNMTDTKFMNDTEHKNSKFAFVHFDGPHMTKDVLTEAIWFANRSAPHTKFVFDDHNTYAMSVIANSLLYFDFKTKEMGQSKCLLERKI
jgi:hypothetical protein